MTIQDVIRMKQEYYLYFTVEESLAAVNQDGLALRHVKEQTPEICMVAVTENGDALRYVKKQTPEICRAAVTQDGA